MAKNKKNKKNKKRVYTGIAVGMAAVMGGVPASAAAEASKEETVYVNADALGNITDVTVSNWLKNKESSDSLQDKTELHDIENVKGEETYSGSESAMTWQANGSDIYYQGKTDKELPVSVGFTYYLDGVEMNPENLVGKSGRLKIKVHYENKAKTSMEINGKEETGYSPFVMVTGLILPEEHFSDVVIDNGKIISDGSKNIVVGVAMPGLKESLKLSQNQEKSITLPEDLEITADVTDFTMQSTFTVAMADILSQVDLGDAADFDELTDSLDELEDAALKLVEGSSSLCEGAETLNEKYSEFDEGIGTLKEGIEQLNGGARKLDSGIDAYTDGARKLDEGIQKYLGSKGVMTGKVTEYKNGVNSVVSGVEAYTKGASTLAEGITEYIKGEQKLAEGAKALKPLTLGLGQISAAIDQMYAALDGQGSAQEDIKTASQTLASGTKQLQDSLERLNELTGQVDALAAEGNQLIQDAKGLSSMMETAVAAPAGTLIVEGQKLAGQLTEIQSAVSSLQSQAQTAIEQAAGQAVTSVNTQISERNRKLAASREAIDTAVSSANTQIQSARNALDAQIKAAEERGDSELAASLKGVRESLQDVSVDTSGIAGLELVGAPDIQVSMPSLDVEGLKETLGGMASSLQSLQKAAGELPDRLTGLQKKLDALTGVEIPEAPMASLKSGVQTLNAGMQGLNGAIGTLSSNVAVLKNQTGSLPEAGKGITALLAGFDTLGSNHEALMAGAAEIRQNAPVLNQGVKTLQSGTSQLAGGISKLSSQLTLGASALVSNNAALTQGAGSLLFGADELLTGAGTLQSASIQVKDGILQLSDGSKELADGMKEFDEEGTGKLKDTVEEELGTILDRMEALGSKECTYDTFSGKTDGMDGSVKFVIETDPIE